MNLQDILNYLLCGVICGGPVLFFAWALAMSQQKVSGIRLNDTEPETDMATEDAQYFVIDSLLDQD